MQQVFAYHHHQDRAITTNYKKQTCGHGSISILYDMEAILTIQDITSMLIQRLTRSLFSHHGDRRYSLPLAFTGAAVAC